MRSYKLPSGGAMPALGLGTWRMGESERRRAQELDAVKYGVELGYPMIDTAEMYGEGRAEEIVGEAIAGRRDEVFLVSKVYPHNASRKGAIAACERSLKRLGTDRIDVYLLHWRGGEKLVDTIAAFETLRRDGKIGSYGVSNFDTDDMEELRRVPGGSAATTNQVLYNLTRRGVEWDLLPWCREHGVPIMAYSPIEQARMLGSSELKKLAEKRGVTAAQLALAWLLHQDGVIAIPKAGRVDHLRENAAALTITLTKDDLAALDHAFPPPKKRKPIEML